MAEVRRILKDLEPTVQVLDILSSRDHLLQGRLMTHTGPLIDSFKNTLYVYVKTNIGSGMVCGPYANVRKEFSLFDKAGWMRRYHPADYYCTGFVISAAFQHATKPKFDADAFIDTVIKRLESKYSFNAPAMERLQKAVGKINQIEGFQRSKKLQSTNDYLAMP